MQLLLRISMSVRGRTSLFRCLHNVQAGQKLMVLGDLNWEAWCLPSCAICALCITVELSITLARAPCPLQIPWLSSTASCFLSESKGMRVCTPQLILSSLCWLFSQQIKQRTSCSGCSKVLLSRMDTLSSALQGTASSTQKQTCLGFTSFSCNEIWEVCQQEEWIMCLA